MKRALIFVLAALLVVLAVPLAAGRPAQVRAGPDYQALRDDVNGALVYVFADGSGQALPFTPAAVSPTLETTPNRSTATALPAPATATTRPTATTVPALAQPELINGSFEQDGGWISYFTQTSSPGKEPSVLRAVKGDGPFAGMTYDGPRSLHLRGEYMCFQGGVYQRVPVVIGQHLILKAWAATWSNSTNLFELASDPNTWQQVSIGIDPKGFTDPSSSRIEWVTRGADDTWQQLTAETYAAASYVTVWLKANLGYKYQNECNWAMQNNWALFDGVTLEAAP